MPRIPGSRKNTRARRGYIYSPGRAGADDFSNYSLLRSVPVSAACGQVTRSTTTDENGAFTISSVPAGTCSLSVTEDGAEKQLGNITAVENPDAVTLTTTGRPVGRATMEDLPDHYGSTIEFRQESTVGTTITDSSGYYVFPDMSEFHTGVIEILADGYSERESGEECTIPASATVNFDSVSNVPDISVPDIALLQKLKYDVRMTEDMSIDVIQAFFDYNTYENGIPPVTVQGDFLHIMVKVYARVDYDFSFFTSHPPPVITITDSEGETKWSYYDPLLVVGSVEIYGGPQGQTFDWTFDVETEPLDPGRYDIEFRFNESTYEDCGYGKDVQYMVPQTAYFYIPQE